MTFPIKSNENVKSTVLNFIKSKRIPHAILIEGGIPTDRAALADFLAAAAVCDSENAPCGSCKNCRLATADSHPDITYIIPEKDKKNIAVDQIRDVRTAAFVKPQYSEKRVFIINDAFHMNEQSFQAFLKILEEPPRGVIFILSVSSKTLLPDTIVSRCILLSLPSAPQSSDNISQMADKFIELLMSGSEYEMLKLLIPIEKSRLTAEEFINALAVACAKKLRESASYSYMLVALYDDTKYYLELLKTNINMSLFTSTVVCRARSLLDK